jgi:hypothetical protein
MFIKHTLLVWLCIISATGLQAQNIVAAEYFFDTDPGISKGKKLTVKQPAGSVHFNDSVSVNSLQPGSHSFSIRTQDSAGIWSLFETRSFYLSQGSGKGLLNIDSAEYFFDADPGIGKGKKLKVKNSSDSVHFNDSVVTTSLQPGTHTFSIRTRTTDGKWSLFDTRSFFMGSGSGKGVLDIDSAEYFFDADPGIGKGNSLVVNNSSDSVHFNDSVSTAGLQAGSHSFSIRTRTTDGKWSLFGTRSFFIGSGSGKGLLNIDSAEYFFDTDPGIGKGKKLKVKNSSDSVHFNDSVSTAGLQRGSHSFSIRTRTTDGKWSLFDTRTFFLGGSGNGLFNITAAEYFFDVDPGIGKATPLNIATQGDSIHINDSVSNVYLPGKNHFFCIRVKTSDGKWSLYESRAFSFLDGNRDRDGLADYEEPFYGTDPLNFDTNGDGLADGVNAFTGLNPLSTDTDSDKISNAQEILNGTSPLLKDTDGDGVPDNKDAFPLDRFRTVIPPKNLSDHTPPVITIVEPF